MTHTLCNYRKIKVFHNQTPTFGDQSWPHIWWPHTCPTHISCRRACFMGAELGDKRQLWHLWLHCSFISGHASPRLPPIHGEHGVVLGHSCLTRGFSNGHLWLGDFLMTWPRPSRDCPACSVLPSPSPFTRVSPAPRTEGSPCLPLPHGHLPQ